MTPDAASRRNAFAIVSAALVFVAGGGCEAEKTTVKTVEQSKAASRAMADVAPRTPALKSEHVTLVGVVLDSAGKPAPQVTVILDRDRKKTSRFLTARTNEDGFFAITGPLPSKHVCAVWAATADGQLGTNWTIRRHQFEGHEIAIPEKLRSVLKKQDGQQFAYARILLRGGETTLYVRDATRQPVAGAVVDVFESGIDDKGIARWPSALGDYDLGFEVAVTGHQTQRGGHYTGKFPKRVKVFMLGDGDDRKCAEMVKRAIASRKSSNRER